MFVERLWLSVEFLANALHFVLSVHIFCSKVTVPLIRKETKRGEFTYYLQQYAKWCFTNSSRMLMGQRFNIFALPNNILWTMILFTIGLFVSKEQAEKSWKKLWR